MVTLAPQMTIVKDWQTKLADMRGASDDITNPNSFDSMNATLFDAKANYSTGSYTQGSDADAENEDRLRRERALSQYGQAVETESERLFSEVQNAVQNAMRGVRTDLQIVETRVLRTEEQIEVHEDTLEQANELLAKEQREALIAQRQLEIDEQAQTDVDEGFDATAEDYTIAMAAGDVEAANRAAAGGMYMSNRQTVMDRVVTESAETSAAETAEFDAAVELRNTVQTQITALRSQLETLTGEQIGLQAELAELEAFQERLNTDETLQSRLENDTLTMADLRDAGMPASVSARLEEQAAARGAPVIASTEATQDGVNLSSPFQAASTGPLESTTSVPAIANGFTRSPALETLDL